VSVFFVLVLGVGGMLAAGYIKESKTIDELRQQQTQLTHENAGLSTKLAAATERANKTSDALGAISSQLAKTKNELATNGLCLDSYGNYVC
jgi:uncharacterized protein involved in exopolysaccharide biosynthesis